MRTDRLIVLAALALAGASSLGAAVNARNGVTIDTASDIGAVTAPISHINGIEVAAASGGGGPTLESAAIDKSGRTLTVVWSEACSAGAGGSSGVAVTLGSGSAAVGVLKDGSSGSDTWVYALTPSVLPTATSGSITVAYTQPGDGIEATTGGADVATFSGSAVTNASTVIFRADMAGTGYNSQPNGESWTETLATDGIVDEDYSTEGISDSGADSLALDEGTGGDVQTFVDIGSGQNAIAFCFKFQLDVALPGNAAAQSLFFAADSGGTARASARYGYNATTGSGILARISTTNGTESTERFATGATIYVFGDYSNVTDVVNIEWSPGFHRLNDVDYQSSATTGVTAAIQRFYFQMTQATGRHLFADLTVWVP